MTTTTEYDALSELEQKVKMDADAEKAAKAISLARSKLVLGKTPSHAFFATLALRLKAQADWSIGTAATDGKRLIYDPSFVANLPAKQVEGLVVHEVMHVAMAHMARLNGRNLQKANIAMDLAINPLVKEAGFELPPGAIFPGQGKFAKLPTGKSFEEYYRLLPTDPPGQQQDQGDSDDGNGWGPEGWGKVQKPGDGSEAAAREAEAEAKIQTSQAAEAAKQKATGKQRGSLPAWIDRLLCDLLQPSVDWKSVLREFVTRQARNDYSWSPPNRRFIHQGLYLPGMRSEELGEVVVAVDTSGSIGEGLLRTFASEIQGILEAYDCEVTIIYHDSDVKHVQTWKSTDGPLVLEAKGGGGTSHIPTFEHIEQEGLNPTCLVGLSDLCSVFPSTPPDYPVMWCVPKGETAPGPGWGQRLEIDC
jgi:predicted metal-dependent peptidase